MRPALVPPSQLDAVPPLREPPVAGSDVVASMEFKTLVFPLRVYFKRILPEIMRINAGGP